VAAHDRGLIRPPFQRGRIEVDEARWDRLEIGEQNDLMRAVACNSWKSVELPAGEKVVAYGNLTGRRLAAIGEVLPR
jgi:hypothetical protein